MISSKIKKVFMTLILFFTLIIMSSTVFAGEQELNDLKFNIMLTETGDMIVEEIWDVYIYETNTLFKTFPIDGTYDQISDVEVKELFDNGTQKNFVKREQYAYHVDEDCYHALVNEDNNFEIAWGVAEDYGSAERKFSITYTINNCVKVYNDTAELYWQLIGDDFGIYSNYISGTIVLPKEVSNIEDLRIWAHGPLNGSINKVSNNMVEFEVSELPAYDYLEIRIATPTEIYPRSTNLYNENKLEAIISEETAWAEEANLRREKALKMEETMRKICAVVEVVVIFFFGFRFFKNKEKLAENPKIKPEIKYDYFRDIPDESASAIEAGFVYYYNKQSSYGDFGRSLSGTFMHLALKRWIEFEVIKQTKKDDVLVTVLASGKEELTEDEKMVYDFLVKVADSKKTSSFTMKEFEKYCIKHNTAFSKMIEKLSKLVKDIAEKKGKYDKSKQKVRDINTLAILGYLFAIIGLLVFAGVTEANVPLTIASELILVLNFITLIILDTRYMGRTQISVDEAEKWAGLKKYMEEFSLIKDREVPELVLWEKYLVFATVFGVAEKVIKQLKVVYPELSDPDSLGSSYAYMHVACNSNTNFNFVNTMNSAIGSATNYSSGSGAGGGFSGGGGGGRRWRWRRRSLISRYIMIIKRIFLYKERFFFIH